MSNYGSVTIVGRLTRDTVTKNVGEHTVTETGIAYDVGFGDKKKPCFIDIAAWNKTGAALARLTKGEQVMVVGELKMDAWEKDGKKQTKHSVSVEKVIYIGSKRDAEAAPAATRPTSPAVAKAFGDEVPF